jgi:hypothetical protein
MRKRRKVFLGLGSDNMGNAQDGTCRTKGCTDSVIATICLGCEKQSIQNSLLPMIRLLRIKYGIKIKDAKSLAETVNLLVLGYEQRKW